MAIADGLMVACAPEASADVCSTPELGEAAEPLTPPAGRALPSPPPPPAITIAFPIADARRSRA